MVKETREVLICDFCGKIIEQTDNEYKCAICKKDVCVRCRTDYEINIGNRYYGNIWLCDEHDKSEFNKIKSVIKFLEKYMEEKTMEYVKNG